MRLQALFKNLRILKHVSCKITHAREVRRHIHSKIVEVKANYSDLIQQLLILNSPYTRPREVGGGGGGAGGALAPLPNIFESSKIN